VGLTAHSGQGDTDAGRPEFQTLSFSDSPDARRSMSDPFAMARARKALTEAGLDPHAPMERASSVTNEVWLTDTYAIRVNRRPNRRLRREAELGPQLPADVRYPHVGADWLIVERVKGQMLAATWPLMSMTDRREAIRQLAEVMRAIHRTAVPDGIGLVEDAPQLFDPHALQIATPLLRALEEVQFRPGVDAALIADARHLVLQSTAALEPFSTATLVHGDLHFQNVLWDGSEITGLIDWEWARGGPPDLDLDVFLRFCANPRWFVCDEFMMSTLAADYAVIPYWIAEDYPELFQHNYVLERMLVYEISYDVFDLLRTPIEGSTRSLQEEHPHRRLEQTMRGDSHLHRLAGEVSWDSSALDLPVDIGAPPLKRAVDSLPKRRDS
jgi:hygromycin-B 7''-O-kinase